MTAFGTYKDTEMIDFTTLTDYNLYVISGQTGAGKTTIFDGICFALYGSASGTDREDYRMLRSDFADDDVHTAVELIFELKNRRYRILRQIGHVKQGNKTKTGEKYEFFELIDDKEKPCVDRQIVSEIDKKVETLIGLTQAQFKQIVMLPQGEFRKLLTSQTENKEEILRRLFKTEKYQYLTEILRERKQTKKEMYEKKTQARNHYVDQLLAYRNNREDSFLPNLEDTEMYNMFQITQALTEEIHFYEKKTAEDKIAYEKAFHKQQVKSEELSKAIQTNERIHELETKKAEKKELDLVEESFKDRKKALSAAEKAYYIEVYEEQVLNARHQELEKVTEQKRVEQKVIDAQSALESAKALYEKELERNQLVEEWKKSQSRLEEHIPVVKELDSKKNMLHTLKQQVEQSTQKEIEIEQRLNQLNTHYEKQETTLQSLEQDERSFYEKEKLLTELRAKVKVVQTYQKLVAQQKQMDEVFAKEKRLFEQRTNSYQQLESKWLQNQAAVLATHLHDGEHCPVCGSLEHPQKATHAETGVSKEQLETERIRLQEQEQIMRASEVNRQSNFKQLTEQETELIEYEIDQNQVANVYSQIVEEGSTLKEEVDALKQRIQSIDKFKNDIQSIKQEIKTLETEKSKASELKQSAKLNYEKASSEYEVKIQSIPEDLRSLSVLEQKRAELSSKINETEQAFQKAEAYYQQQKENTTNQIAHEKHAKDSVKEAKENREQSEKIFKDKQLESGFETLEAYAHAKQSKEERDREKRAIEMYEQKCSHVHQQLLQLQEQLQGQSLIDLEQLRAELTQLKEAYEHAFSTWSHGTTTYESLQELRDNIRNEQEFVEQTERELATISDLFDTIRGQNEQKISFERYLQIEYLEQIIHAANQRLHRISNGQFLLMRSDRQEARGRQSGLALDVHDSYTGQTRDVKTLSGGEKFNASLCLALGMSDVIQSFQGNISIETMFIDEGFGSLDEESLHKAIDTLVELQKSGRMIGVISHVQELKDIFPATLEVKKTKEGYSQTKFVLK